MQVLRKRTGACLLALALAGALSPAVALAADPEPSVVNDGTTGSTDMVVQIADASEVQVPDENLNFTVPSRINYVAIADGTLVGPSNAYIGLAYIENKSAYKAYVSAYQAKVESPFTVVEDASTVGNGVRNAISVEIGPAADKRDVAEGGSKAAGASQKSIAGGETGSKIELTDDAWDMKAKDSPANASRVYLETGGHVANIDANINTAVKFATINWYLTPGTRTS